MSTTQDTAHLFVLQRRNPRTNRGCVMRMLLYAAAGVATLYAATRAVWHSDGELGIELALLIAAVCWGSGAIVDAIERSRPKPVSPDNGKARKDE